MLQHASLNGATTTMSIERYVKERGIAALVHFTRVDNLASIMQHGLCVPSACVNNGLKAVRNDHYRHDGADAVCATITVPNYKMFYPLRIKAPAGTNWVVLAIRPSILWETDCAFCTTNAASATVTAIPLAQRRGLEAMKLMFADYPGKPRADLKIPDNYTTNPQAEVLLLEGVALKYIIGMVFNTANLHAQYKAKYEGKPPLHTHIKSYHYPNSFLPRKDKDHWPRNG
jgi:hypothetical protein